MQKVIEALFFAYLVFYPFGQLTRIPLPSFIPPEVHLYLSEVIIFFLLLFWSIGITKLHLEGVAGQHLPGDRMGSWKASSLPALTWPVVIFTAVAVVSLILNAPRYQIREILISSTYLFRWVLYAGLYFFLVDVGRFFPWAKKKILSNILLILGSAVGVFGLIQYLFWPNLRALEIFGWDPHSYRVAGTFLDPGFTGIILVLTALPYFNSLKTPSRWPNGLLEGGVATLTGWGNWRIIGMATVLIALILTYSRASWLALIVGVALMVILRRLWRALVLLAVAITLLLIFVPRPAGEGGQLGRIYSAQSRYENWQYSLNLVGESPLLGVGFNTLRYVQRDPGHAGAGVDSSLLFVILTTGIIGLAAYLWIWIKALKTYSHQKLLVWPIIAALFVHSGFLNSLFYPWVMGWVWMFFASRENN